MKAAQIVGEAHRRAPEAAASKPGPEGRPSRLAETLMQLLDAEPNSVREMRVSNFDFASNVAANPGARHYRAVYKLADGSIVAVHDAGAEVAASEDQVIRYSNREFAGVWDGKDMGALERAISNGIQRLGAPREQRAAAAKALGIGQLRPAGDDHPLAQQFDVIGMTADGHTVVMTDDGPEIIPPTAEEALGLVEHANKVARMMVEELGMDEDQLMAEVAAGGRVYVDAAAAMTIMEQARRESQASPLSENDIANRFKPTL